MTLILSLAIVLAFYLKDFNIEESASESQDRKAINRFGAVGIVFFLGAHLIVLVFLLQQREMDKGAVALSYRQWQGFSEAVRQRFAQALAISSTLGGFFEASVTVGRDEFKRFARPLIEGFPIQAVEWIPHVPEVERSSTEAKVRSEGFPEFSFREMASGGVLVQAASRSEYFPVFYCEPEKGNERAFGFDLGSEPRRRGALFRARDDATGRSIAPVRLIQDSGTCTGFLAFAPVFSAPEVGTGLPDRQRRLRGFALSVFRIEEMVREIVKHSLPDGSRVEINDCSIQGNPTIILAMDSSGREPGPDRGWNDLRFAAFLPVPGSDWMLSAEFSGQGRGGLQRRRGFFLPLALLLFVLISALLVHSLANERNHAQALVRKATRELADENLRFSVAVTSAGIGVWEWDIPRNILTWDDEMFRFYGVRREEFAGAYEAWTAGLHPEDRTMSEERIARALRGEGEFEAQFRILTPSGETRYLRAYSRTQRDPDGKPLRMIGVNYDVTERVLAQKALEESETRFRLMFERHNAPMLLVAPEDGSIVDANLAACAFYGYPREAFRKMAITEVNCLPPDEVREAMQAAGEGERNAFIFPHRLASGETRTVEVHSTLVEFGSRKVFFSIIHDITERKRFEESLEQSRRELEEANTRLRESMEQATKLTREAERANAAKSEFLANMSHEIRTPMNGIIGMSGLLMETTLSPEQRKFAGVIRSSSEVLLGLINDILDFSKIEARKLDLEILDFDLRLMLEDTFEILAIRAAEKGLEIACQVEPEVPSRLRGDPGRLRQIVTNLVGNAVKFTSKGSVVLHVTLVAEKGKQLVLRFEVADTGIGIPPEHRANLFSPFVQGDGSTTRKFGGTGLGLAISKRLTELMNGNIGVVSEPGRGSKFWFTVVLEQRPIEKQAPVESRAELRGVKVLVVDDASLNRMVMTSFLHSWSCRYEEAETAAEALEMLRAATGQGEPFDAAIIDMCLPEMDGAQLGHAIGQDQSLRGVRLILATSLVQRGAAKQAQGAGFAGFLTKPVREEYLRECLEIALGRRSSEEDRAKGLITRHVVDEARKARVRILVVEDNPTNQMVILTMLEKLGYKADAVGNGKEAVTSLAQVPYDLVFMDCQMPEMDGFEATSHIRSGKAGTLRGNVPIIALTANAMQGDRDRCETAGMNDYLAKPVQPRDVDAMLTKWLGTGEMTRKEPSGHPPVDAPPVPVPADQLSVREVGETFDEADLLARLDDDRELVCLLTPRFMSDMQEHIRSLRVQLKEGKLDSAKRLAHTVKGAAGTMAALGLKRAARDLERILGEENEDRVNEALRELECAYDRLGAVLVKTRYLSEFSAVFQHR